MNCVIYSGLMALKLGAACYSKQDLMIIKPSLLFDCFFTSEHHAEHHGQLQKSFSENLDLDHKGTITEK